MGSGPQVADAELVRLASSAARLKATNALMWEFFHAVRDEHKQACRAADRSRLDRLRRSGRYAQAFEAPEPLVSVIIPTLNRARLILERALPSVLDQDYANWELVIVGDAMEPEQAAVLAGIRDPRVRFYNLRRRGRYPQAPGPRWCVAGIKPMNFGLRVARGDWITHLDDDDEYTDDHISALLRLARERRVEWTHGKVLFVNERGGDAVALGDPHPAFGRISRISSLYMGVLKTFRYDAGCWRYFYPGDWDLWERFLDMGVTHAHLDLVIGTHFESKVSAVKQYEPKEKVRTEPSPARAAGWSGLRRWLPRGLR